MHFRLEICGNEETVKQTLHHLSLWLINIAALILQGPIAPPLAPACVVTNDHAETLPAIAPPPPRSLSFIHSGFNAVKNISRAQVEMAADIGKAIAATSYTSIRCMCISP